jgi:hypothetical protein
MTEEAFYKKPTLVQPRFLTPYTVGGVDFDNFFYWQTLTFCNG